MNAKANTILARQRWLHFAQNVLTTYMDIQIVITPFLKEGAKNVTGINQNQIMTECLAKTRK